MTSILSHPKTQIPSRQASRLLDSVAFANDQHGVLFNAMFTLNFDQLGISDPDEKARALTRFNVSLAGKLASFPKSAGLLRCGLTISCQHFFVYVHERVRSVGHHAHQAVVLPYGMRPEIEGWLQRWRCKHYPASVPEAVHILFPSRPSKVRDQVALQARLIKYMLKTAAPVGVDDRDGNSVELHDVLGLKPNCKSQPIEVRRMAGVSENLAILAQRKVEYPLLQHWEDLLSEKNYRNFHARSCNQELAAQLHVLNR